MSDQDDQFILREIAAKELVEIYANTLKNNPNLASKQRAKLLDNILRAIENDKCYRAEAQKHANAELMKFQKENPDIQLMPPAPANESTHNKPRTGKV